jgi:hypothetical protein
MAGPSAGSWPVAAFGSFIYRSSTMQDCAKARALASFFYWSQADPSSQAIANEYGPSRSLPPLTVDRIRYLQANALILSLATVKDWCCPRRRYTCADSSLVSSRGSRAMGSR